MTWPQMLAALLAGFVIAGGVSIVLVVWHWQNIGRVVSDLLAKILAGAVKLIAGMASVGGAYAAAQKEEWLLPALLAVVCLVQWEVLEKLIDNRVKASDKADKEALKRAEQESESRTELLILFSDAVTMKIKRLMRAMTKRRGKPTVPLVRAALTPDDHLDNLLDSLAAYFAEQRPPAAPLATNFRVGLYVNRNGTMVPLRAVNLNNPSYDVFTSFATHGSAFRFDAERPSHLVTCVRERRTLIVPDCMAAAGKGEFHFFNDNQRGYLRSMVAFYLGQVYCEDGTNAEAALVIDTDWAGYFGEQDRDSLVFHLKEFGARIKLELLLHAVLAERGGEA